MTRNPERVAKLSAAEREAYDECTERFDERWRATPDTPPDIGASLPAAGPLRRAVLIDLVRTDLEQRRVQGKSISVQNYCDDFPELMEDASARLELEEWHEALCRRALAAGSDVSHYTVLRRLGGGGMGDVYAAQDNKLQRHVALKFLSPALARDPQALERFSREARTVSKLNHPHICTLHDRGEHDGQPYLVLELVEGAPLTEYIRRGGAPAEAARLGEQLANALAAVHAAGVVHRDLKPGNILVRRDGHAKLLDFGLARLVPPGREPWHGEPRDLTVQGAFLGTARYTSPEQTRGEPAGAPSDVFSLGVLLYELATGQHPFEADGAVAVMHAIQTRPLTPPRLLNPDVSQPLEDLLLRMLERDPSRRPSATEVGRILEKAPERLQQAYERQRDLGGSGPQVQDQSNRLRQVSHQEAPEGAVSNREARPAKNNRRMLVLVLVLIFSAMAVSVDAVMNWLEEDPYKSPDQSEYPDRHLAIPNFPKKDDVKAKPRIQPDEVTFKYRNESPDPLLLVFFDFSRHFGLVEIDQEDSLVPLEPWYTRKMKPNDTGVKDDFEFGTGWVAFFAYNRKLSDPGARFCYLDRYNIFEAKSSILVVKPNNDPKKPYVGEFRKE